MNLPPSIRNRAFSSQRPGDSVNVRPAVSAFVQSVRADVQVKLLSTANRREHWSERARRAKEHRQRVQSVFAGRVLPMLPVNVELTRYAPSNRGTLDYDNLTISLKHVRDAVAGLYGIDDADQRIKFEYGQQIGTWKAEVVINQRLIEDCQRRTK